MQKNYRIDTKLTKVCLKISYLAFVDDYLISRRATKIVARKGKNILEHIARFLDSSLISINLIPVNVKTLVRKELAEILNITPNLTLMEGSCVI